MTQPQNTTTETTLPGEIICTIPDCPKPGFLAVLLRHALHPRICKRPIWWILCEHHHQQIINDLADITRTIRQPIIMRCDYCQTRITHHTDILQNTKPI